MADESTSAEGIFRHSTMNRVASSEELDHYIKVTNPSAWVIVLAALLLIGGIIVWAAIAVVPVTVETTGITFTTNDSNKTNVICFVNEETADRVRKQRMIAFVEGVEANDATMTEMPLSATEVISILGSDFYVDSIDLDAWNYMVTIEPGGELMQTDFSIDTAVGKSRLVPVSLIVRETNPIKIVLGDKS